MSKRMTDNDKWKKPFIKGLPVEYKLFWLYILDDCDHAGVWHVDADVAELRLGIKLSLKRAEGLFEGKVVSFDSGTKWFIPDFIAFQYGEFNEANKMYRSILPVLKKYDLIPHLSPIYPPKVKVTVQVPVKVKDNRDDFLENQTWKEQFCMTKGMTMKDLEKLQADWLTDLELKGEVTDNYQRYFTNWFNKGGVIPKTGSKKYDPFNPKSVIC